MKKTPDFKIAKRLISTYDSAESRGIECTLTFKRMKQLLNTEKCFYTGEIMSDEDGKPNQLTLDRVDNNVGYKDNNVVACTRAINLKKGGLTLDEIRLFYNKTKNR